MINTKDQPATHESQMENQAMSHSKNYQKLAIMTVLSFVSMYVLMYAMVNVIDNVYNSLNQVYMAGLMTAPMVIFALTVMRMMYPNKRLNAILIAGSVIAGIAFFAFIQKQTVIADQQFLRSMIPHHAGAITMCEEASLTDPEIQTLCESIIANQQQEIDQMRAILERLD